MLIDTLKARLVEQFPDCDIEASAEGNHCHVRIVGDVFSGLRPVKRQQMVYAALNEWIADGSVHAVHMSLQTTAEAQG
ncbi:MAG TPA: cell division protein BolA [Spongiibacteraceae bacterium]|nr:cell division protein BolA [Spongiibacteraceae bacterium]HCS29710.1 cell division protein BolA [Spongiibacteraceae bacterium]|tara:strand:- start:1596 stop:1829 length:234 start_codon:yes stop_codon:yes gene_type:complete